MITKERNGSSPRGARKARRPLLLRRLPSHSLSKHYIENLKKEHHHVEKTVRNVLSI